MKYTPREQIVKAKIDLQRNAPFFAHLVMNMNITEDINVPTMGVNFKGNAKYNPEWIATLSLNETQGVLCHEVMHVALTHLLRLGKKDMMTWNIACDMLINYMILQEGFELPTGILIPDGSTYTLPIQGSSDLVIDVKGKVAEEVYEELEQHLPKCKCPCHSEKCSVKPEDGDSDDDDDGDGDGDGDGDNSGCGCGCPSYGFDSHEYHDGELSETEKQAIEKEWKAKLVDAATSAKARGKLPANMERLIDGLLNPKLNWKAILYQYITKDILYNHTYKKPGRRSHATGIYMPSEIKENLEVTVTVDTSGSISNTEFTEFMSEVSGIANAFEQINMKILFWDTRVQSEYTVTRGNKNKLAEIPVAGGGGTYISCLDDYYQGKRPPQIMIHLTDGHIEYNPKLPYSKHLFVLGSNSTSDIVKNHGLVTKLENV